MYEGSAWLEPHFGLYLPPLVLTFTRFDCDMAYAGNGRDHGRVQAINRSRIRVVAVGHDCVCKIEIQQQRNVSIGPKTHQTVLILHLHSARLLSFSALSASMEKKLPQLS